MRPPDQPRPLLGAIVAPGLHVMTWNVRRRVTHSIHPSRDRWDRRSSFLRALLRQEQPTILGIQEARAHQARFVRDSLGPRYRIIGHGRDADGQGEGCPICFDGERLELLDWRQSALSDRPSAAGSRSWGNLLPRIMVAAAFRDRSTSARFFVVNTHLDPLSRRSRIRSAQVIRDTVAERALPGVVMGDFNAEASSTSLRDLFSEGTLVDAWEHREARVTSDWSTFSNYRPPRAGGRRIDLIAVSPRIVVARVAINARPYAGGFGSDHLPVQAEILLTEDGERG